MADNEQITFEEFLERGKKAQAEIDRIIQPSDRKARTRPRARSTDPQTSHKAARRAGEKVTWSQRAVLECFEKLREKHLASGVPANMAGGMTDPELIAIYHRGMHNAENNWPYQSDSGLRTRRHELVEKPHEKIVKIGEQEREKGKPFTIWGLKCE